VATALNMKGLRGKDFFRLAFFVPVVLSPVIVAILFNIILDKQFGLLNAFLRGVLGIGPIDFLGSPTWSKVAIMIVMLWRWTGYLVIYFLAGLNNIPTELYEAADLDGAGPVSKFRHVSVPMLRPITAFVVITIFIALAQVFEEPFILTGGGPGQSSTSVAEFIYNQAFQQQAFGYAAAAGVVLFLAVFVVTQFLARFYKVGVTR
jgi:multiple sugar transport system permease protein